MARCLIALGANLGDREENLRLAVDRLRRHRAVTAVVVSRPRETAAVGGPAGQGAFLNAAAAFDTSLAPHEVLALLQEIESRLGRRREVRWGPRTLDLDLLLYDELTLADPALELPHPRMAWRRFVLEPAAEVAPAMVHPPTGWTLARLLEHLQTTPAYFALAGPIGAGKSELAGRLATAIPARLVAEQLNAAGLAAFYADPSSRAWGMELEFLAQRARLLARDGPEWIAPQGVAVSDFWFDQSLAFARVWLAAEPFATFAERCRDARRSVVVPRITVYLDAPTDELLQRIRRRGRRGEESLTADVLDRLRDSLAAVLRMPDRGPVLRLENRTLDDAQREIATAIASA